MNIQNEVQKALQYYHAGEYQQAKQVCKRILKVESNNAEVLYFLGVVYSHLGNYAYAIRYIKESLALYPNNPDGYHLVAMSYQELGQLEEAIEYYRKTIQHNPNYAEAYNNLANLLKERGLREEALIHYQKAAALRPESAMLQYNLGVICQEMKDFANAIHSYRQALQHEPNNRKMLLMLASVFHEEGKLYGKQESFQEAERISRAMIQTDPADFMAHTNLGKVLQDQGKLSESIASYRKALELNPSYDEAHFSLADVLHETGYSDESIRHYQKAIEVNPGFADAYNNLGVVLGERNRLDESVDCFQKMLRLDNYSPRSARAFSNLGNVFSELGKPEEAEKYYREALSREPALSKVHSNLLLSMNYTSRYTAGEVYAEHLNYARQFAEPLYPSQSYSFRNEKEHGRRLRIGYLSPDFRRHSVAYFIEPVIKAHNRELFEVFCYSDIAKPDEVTKRIRSLADQWRDIAQLMDEQIAELVRAEKIDILVDLAGHTAKNRLFVFARKPAPVQASWIGYPSTTGITAIDYKIVDWYTDPPGASEQHYTERLVRLPGSFLCYLPDRQAPDIGVLPALKNGYITFGSFNNLAKVSDDIALVWVEILKALPGSRLFIKAKGLISKQAANDKMGFFLRHGIEEGRIHLSPPTHTVPEHLALYNGIDIALDTFPYNGATTTCEALWMGVPVITLAGQAHASRVGASLLSNLGLTDLVAGSPDEYHQIAKTLGDNLDRLASLRRELRDLMAKSPLTDEQQFTGNLESAYREMWMEWCQK